MGGRCSTTITAAPSPKSFGFRSVRSWCVVCCICVCCLHQGSATPGRKRETVQMLRQYTHTRTHRKTKHAPLEGQPGVRESQHDQSQDSRAAHPVRRQRSTRKNLTRFNSTAVYKDHGIRGTIPLELWNLLETAFVSTSCGGTCATRTGSPGAQTPHIPP